MSLNQSCIDCETSAAALGVSVVPLVVLGNVKDRRLLPIGSGVLSAQEIVERIYILTQTRPGELY